MGLAGLHLAKTNIQRGTPCSKMEPTREMKSGRPRSTRRSVETVDVGTLLGSTGSFVPRQGQVEEDCGRPMLHKGIRQV